VTCEAVVSSPVQPYPIYPRIPDDQPFIVNISLKKWGLRAGLGGGVLVVMFLCLAGVVGSDAGIGAALVLIGLAVLVVVLVAVQIWRQSSGGPVLAAGPAGLWIRTRQSHGQAIWLPWEAIASISRRRWRYDKVLVVQPRDPRATKGLGARTALSMFNNSIAFGDGFIASLNMADKKEDEILQAIAYFAANRVPLA
jgi:hypothetical protein